MRYNNKEIYETIFKGKRYYLAKDIGEAAGFSNIPQARRIRCKETKRLPYRDNMNTFIDEENALWLSAGTEFGRYLYKEIENNRPLTNIDVLLDNLTLTDYNKLCVEFGLKRRKQLLIQIFIRDYTIQNEYIYCSVDTLYDAYAAFCSFNDCEAESKAGFNLWMTGRNYKKRGSSTKRSEILWMGLDLRSDFELTLEQED